MFAYTFILSVIIYDTYVSLFHISFHLAYMTISVMLRLYVYQEKEFLQRFIFLAVDLFHAFVVTFKSTFTYHLTARVVGHH